MKAVVLAGGRGTRLGALSAALPKPMQPIGSRPFLEYLLDRLIAGGVDRIVLSLHYLADVVVRHFGARYRDVPIRYAVEPEPMGTGGAIAYALSLEPAAGPVLIANGDTFLGLDYAGFLEWYREDPTPLAVIVRRQQDAGRYGNVQVRDGIVVGFAAAGDGGESAFINAGSYILDPGRLGGLLALSPFSFETDFLRVRFPGLKARAYEFNGYFVDIGVPDDLIRAGRELPRLSS